MLELSSEDDVYTFTYDGEKRTIRALSVDDLEDMDGILTAKPADRARAAKLYLLERAKDAATKKVIEGLSLNSTLKLFKGWAGMPLGESSTSDQS